MKIAPVLFALYVVSAFGKVYFKDTFSDEEWEKRWVYSKTKSDQGRFKWTAGKYFGDPEINKGIQTNEDNKYYAMTGKAPEPFSNDGKTLVFQFDVKHENNPECAGGYVKLLPATLDQVRFDGESKYYIMFGPDVCGSTRKVHLIFHYNGKNLNWKKEPRGEWDTLTHQYRVVIHPNHTYDYYCDGEVKESGSLEEDWDFLQPKLINDPYDRKPSDWEDEAELDDPTDVKPADWDSEPEFIPDPNAIKPDDWNEEEDGSWEPPQVPNPKYKGVFRPRKIPNPKYKGEWKPKQIPNPEYVPDDKLGVYDDFGVVGFDLWQVKSGSLFDNIFVGDDLEEAIAFTKETFDATREAERKAKEKFDEEERAEKEAARKAAPEGGDAASAAGEEEEEEDEL